MRQLVFRVQRCGAGVLLALAASARGGDIQSRVLSLDDNPNTSPPAETPSYASGNWLGVRPALDKKGITIAGLVDLDTTKVLRGGADTDRTAIRYLLDLNVTLDMEKFLGWRGGTLFFDFQSHDGPNASPGIAGDVQGFDNMDAPHFVQIYQLWYQQKLAGDAIRVKAGKINSNADFSVVDHGSEFLSSAAAYSPTIFTMITFPDPAPGADMFFQPNDWLYAGVGAFYSNRGQRFLDLTGHPQFVERTNGGTLVIAEIGSRWKLPFHGQSLPGHAGVGGWFHTGEFPRISNPAVRAHGSGGPYVFADQSLWTRNAAKDHVAQDIGVFFIGGYADARTSPIDQQLCGGVAATGFIPSRPNDVIGSLVSWAHLPSQPLLNHHEEIEFEAFYKAQIFPWFSLKPDFQYIVNPSGRFSDAAVFTVRAEVDF